MQHYRITHLHKQKFENKKPGEVDFKTSYYVKMSKWNNKRTNKELEPNDIRRFLIRPDE